MAHFTGETGTIYESDMLCIGENVFPATYYRDPDNGTITIRTQVESPEGLRSASGLPSIVVPKRELGKADMGVPQKVVQFQREKPRLIIAHKPHDFWQIQPAEGMLVRCADGTRCNHFATFPASPSRLPGT